MELDVLGVAFASQSARAASVGEDLEVVDPFLGARLAECASAENPRYSSPC